jgi:TRAP-type uncharacterized transport system substrate-binding protein
MPNHPSRMGRLRDGELDAIFDEGVVMWADQVTGAGVSPLPISPAQPDALEAQGYRRAVIEQDRYPSLPADVPALDYGGWPIFCRSDTPDPLVDQFCRALPVTPMEVPLHPRAAAVWAGQGYMR